METIPLFLLLHRLEVARVVQVEDRVVALIGMGNPVAEMFLMSDLHHKDIEAVTHIPVLLVVVEQEAWV
jgi:3-methyladenine DNA glycosylase/8-oxoguanine DNA glycosylase